MEGAFNQHTLCPQVGPWPIRYPDRRTFFGDVTYDVAEEGLAPPLDDADRKVIKVTSGGQPMRVGNSMVPMPALV